MNPPYRLDFLNPLISLASLNDLVGVWAEAMVRASCQAGLLALVVWAVCRAAPSIPARCQSWLWRLTLLKFLVAVVWHLPVELPLLPPQPAAAAPVAGVAAAGIAAADSLSADGPTLSPTGAPTTLSLPPSPNEAASTDRSANYRRWLLLAWLVGVGWGFAQIALACRAASRLRKSSRACRDSLLLDAAARVARLIGLRRQPVLLEAAGTGSPLLLGVVRPAVIVPAATLRRLDASERELILGHELAHLRHRDIVWRLFAACARAVFFFHPAAWLCERRLRLAQEVAADELAMSLRGESPADYAQKLLRIVLKCSPPKSNLAMAVAVAGAHQSLKERFVAMRFIVPSSRRLRIGYALFSAALAVIGIVPWALVAAEPPTAPAAAEKPPAADKPPAAEKPPAADKPAAANKPRAVEKPPAADKPAAANKPRAVEKPQAATSPDPPARMLTQGKGKFVSFRDGTLTLEGPSGPLLWKDIDAGTKAYLGLGKGRDKDRGYRPVETLDALSKIKPGTQVFVGSWFGYEKRHGIFIGVVPGQAIGTFVSFKDGALSLLATDRPGGSFTKKYGNSIFIRNLPNDAPVEESVDGGEFERIGAVKEVLANVAEGTVVTVHFLGEGNVTLIQLGVPKK